MTANEFLEATRWMSEQEYKDFVHGMSKIRVDEINHKGWNDAMHFIFDNDEKVSKKAESEDL